MIFHKYRAIFFHIGKTAGVSIENWLDGTKYDIHRANREVMFGWDKEENVYLQHATLALIKKLTEPDIFNQYYKFSVVRNPFTRAISVYYYLYDQHQKQYGCFEHYIKCLPTLLKSDYLYKGSHHIPQVFYTHIENKCICDQIIKFEQLPNSLSPVKEQLKLNTNPKHHNKIIHLMRPQKHPAEIYTKEMTQIMLDAYADDFEAFGYSKHLEDS